MKIVIDENIALAEEAFSGIGDVHLYPGREITNAVLKDADVLITRSVTYVDENLLKNTKVKFVGTATIGWDHIDTNYLDKQNIYFTSAQGCNSDAVTEYVFASLFRLASEHNITLRGKKLGIVGVGNIGSRVAAIASALGMNIFLNDPPLARKTGSDRYLPLHELFSCDIITLHVPLNLSGDDRTYHLLDSDNLRLLKDGAILINSSRGPVADNSALVKLIRGKNLLVVLDVWEDEPLVSTELLSMTQIATPHIAGYSVEGKINGTKIIYDALCRFTGSDPGWIHQGDNTISKIALKKPGNFEDTINSVISEAYKIKRDDIEMRKMLNMSRSEIPSYFDLLRKKYPLRKEFFNYSVEGVEDDITRKALVSLRFR